MNQDTPEMSEYGQMRSCALLSLLDIKNKLDQDHHLTVLRLLASHLREASKEYSFKGTLSFPQDEDKVGKERGLGGRGSVI